MQKRNISLSKYKYKLLKTDLVYKGLPQLLDNSFLKYKEEITLRVNYYVLLTAKKFSFGVLSLQ